MMSQYSSGIFIMPFQSPITHFIYCLKMKITRKKIKYSAQFSLSLTLSSLSQYFALFLKDRKRKQQIPSQIN
jgi:hypothetical protein